VSASLAELRRQVHDQLADARRVIARLRRDLEQTRAEVRELAPDRDRLQRALVQIDVLTIARDQAEAQARASRRDQTDAEQLLLDTEEDNRLLAERCEGLERALAREREEVSAAKLEIRCLEQQTEQLQSIVDMLTGETKAAS
jgi:chromosome segregation ATPase